jgi:hypothetical protein
MSEATSYYHNVFIFKLFLPEGRAGVAWEPSNKMMFFLPSEIRLKKLNNEQPGCVVFLARHEPNTPS